jgi:hypothetical protein
MIRGPLSVSCGKVCVKIHRYEVKPFFQGGASRIVPAPGGGTILRWGRDQAAPHKHEVKVARSQTPTEGNLKGPHSALPLPLPLL